ncbi:hypothetical protein CCUS01_15396 [Colletotrichum cuscutae]|uniref:Uncharacterized protein n=1 Tax=Colletotrichum cuscutae TaxID=1209917 RepID=A0AAI9VE31_9PEZI|nr:hypothetical protein CCUS01_15396 [Colletotrichum cuscutae]
MPAKRVSPFIPMCHGSQLFGDPWRRLRRSFAFTFHHHITIIVELTLGVAHKVKLSLRVEDGAQRSFRQVGERRDIHGNVSRKGNTQSELLDTGHGRHVSDRQLGGDDLPWNREISISRHPFLTRERISRELDSRSTLHFVVRMIRVSCFKLMNGGRVILLRKILAKAELQVRHYLRCRSHNDYTRSMIQRALVAPEHTVAAKSLQGKVRWDCKPVSWELQTFSCDGQSTDSGGPRKQQQKKERPSTAISHNADAPSQFSFQPDLMLEVTEQKGQREKKRGGGTCCFHRVALLGPLAANDPHSDGMLGACGYRERRCTFVNGCHDTCWAEARWIRSDRTTGIFCSRWLCLDVPGMDSLPSHLTIEGCHGPLSGLCGMLMGNACANLEPCLVQSLGGWAGSHGNGEGQGLSPVPSSPRMPPLFVCRRLFDLLASPTGSQIRRLAMSMRQVHRGCIPRSWAPPHGNCLGFAEALIVCTTVCTWWNSNSVRAQYSEERETETKEERKRKRKDEESQSDKPIYLTLRQIEVGTSGYPYLPPVSKVPKVPSIPLGKLEAEVVLASLISSSVTNRKVPPQSRYLKEPQEEVSSTLALLLGAGFPRELQRTFISISITHLQVLRLTFSLYQKDAASYLTSDTRHPQGTYHLIQDIPKLNFPGFERHAAPVAPRAGTQYFHGIVDLLYDGTPAAPYPLPIDFPCCTSARDQSIADGEPTDLQQIEMANRLCL